MQTTPQTLLQESKIFTKVKEPTAQNNHRLSLIYASEFDTERGNLIQVSEDFLEYLDSTSEPIEFHGAAEENCLISTDRTTYKLKGVNLPTSMLIVNETTGSVKFELSNYLKLEGYHHEYHKIYDWFCSPETSISDPKELLQMIGGSGSAKTRLNEAQKMEVEEPENHDNSHPSSSESPLYDPVFQKYGISDSEIVSKFKISIKEFEEFEKHLDFIRRGDRRVFIGVQLMLGFLRDFLIKVNENKLFGKVFAYEEVEKLDMYHNQEVFALAAKKFCFLLPSTDEPHSERSQAVLCGHGSTHMRDATRGLYRVTWESVYNFILLELAMTKPQYLTSQMDSLISELLMIYVPSLSHDNISSDHSQSLPPAIPPTTQEKQRIGKKTLSKYFIEYAPKGINGQSQQQTLRQYYNPLSIESTLKGRLKFMSQFKSKWRMDEIKGVFDCIVFKGDDKGPSAIKLKKVAVKEATTSEQLNKKSEKQAERVEIDWDDLLLKNFRKFGELYEIKLVLPKK